MLQWKSSAPSAAIVCRRALTSATRRTASPICTICATIASILRQCSECTFPRGFVVHFHFDFLINIVSIDPSTCSRKINVTELQFTTHVYLANQVVRVQKQIIVLSVINLLCKIRPPQTHRKLLNGCRPLLPTQPISVAFSISAWASVFCPPSSCSSTCW